MPASLRFRLVAGLMALLTLGLVVFGVTVTSLYSRSQYQQLDEDLRRSAPFAMARLSGELGRDPGPVDPSPEDRQRPAGDPPTALGPDTFVQLRSPTGDVLATGTLLSGSGTPDLPDDLAPAEIGGRFLTVGSATGEGDWRVLVDTDRFTGLTNVVAVPLADVTDPIRNLVIIEVVAALALLGLLGGGSWWILRRGLRPLEDMAASARSITSGNLAQRVSPTDAQSEVGQLGLALNTMLAEIEEAFRERDATEQRLRQFLADASHELRTPLTSIQGFAELFRLGAAEDREQLAVVLRRIEQESDRMKVLVEELLLLARLDETRPVDRADVDLVVLAADACSDASAVAPDRAVTLDAPEPVTVHGDRDHLRQALANLVTNAVRHTPAGAPIEVVVRRSGEDGTVTVRDHGDGLAPDALAHVFDRFWRADSARVGTGTGLGLSIVAAIAAEHDGTVSAENHPDGGAAFTLRIPLAAG